MPKRMDIDSVSMAVPDDFERLVDLMGYGAALRGRIVDGLLTFATSGVDVGYGGGETVPAAGSAIAAGSGLSWGSGGPGWLIERIYIRETSAGGGATAVFAGTVDQA